MKSRLSTPTFVLIALFVLAGSGFAQDKWGTRGGSSGFPDIPRNAASDDDEKRFDSIASKMGVPGKELRRRFKEEREKTPGLTHAQFVIAYMVSREKSRGISPEDVLAAIGSGKTIGQVLRANGMTPDQIKAERARIRSEVKSDKRFKDRDSFWRF